jgi:hypothetical protein
MRFRQSPSCGGGMACAVLVALTAAVLAARCAKPPPVTLHNLADRYVLVALQLAQHQPALVDAWLGPETLNPGERLPVADLARTVAEIGAEAERIRPDDLDPTEHARLDYLRGQLRALALVARRLAGESMRFDDEVRLAYDRGVPRDGENEAAQARARLDNELRGQGELADRYRSFRSQYAIPGDRVERVFAAAIDACRAATATYVAMPGDERIDLRIDASTEFAGSARYAGHHQTRIAIATRDGWDVARVLHVACHETYPGHHLQNILIDDALVKGRGWQEFQLMPAFGPHLLIAEGAAEAGADLVMREETRAAVYRDRLLPLAGINTADAARLARIDALATPLDGAVPSILARYFDNAATEAETLTALAREALLPAPGQFLAFAERRRTAAVAYPIGRRVVSNWLSRDPNDPERWRRLQDVFTRDPFRVD